MEVSQNLIDAFNKIKYSLKLFECEKHGIDEKNTSKTCYKCKIEQEVLEEIENSRKIFAQKQKKANIDEDIVAKDSTFDNYVPTNNKAIDFKNKVLSYKYDKNILACGNTGNGKTHMGYALINQALQNNMTAFHILFYNLNRTYIKHEDIYNYLIRCDFLVIDEFGIQDSDYTGGILYMVIDERTRRNKWTMVVTNLTATEFRSKISTSLLSRFKQNDILMLNTDWDDYRITKCGSKK